MVGDGVALAVGLREHLDLVVAGRRGGVGPAVGGNAEVVALARGGIREVLGYASVLAVVIALDKMVDEGELRTACGMSV